MIPSSALRPLVDDCVLNEAVSSGMLPSDLTPDDLQSMAFGIRLFMENNGVATKKFIDVANALDALSLFAPEDIQYLRNLDPAAGG